MEFLKQQGAGDEFYGRVEVDGSVVYELFPSETAQGVDEPLWSDIKRPKVVMISDRGVHTAPLDGYHTIHKDNSDFEVVEADSVQLKTTWHESEGYNILSDSERTRTYKVYRVGDNNVTLNAVPATKIKYYFDSEDVKVVESEMTKRLEHLAEICATKEVKAKFRLIKLLPDNFFNEELYDELRVCINHKNGRFKVAHNSKLSIS